MQVDDKAKAKSVKQKRLPQENLIHIPLKSQDYLTIKAMFNCINEEANTARPAINQIYYHPNRDEFVACDGHILRVHKAIWDEDDKPKRAFFLKECDFLHTAASIRKSDLPSVHVLVHYLDLEYPDYAACIHDLKDSVPLDTFSFDLDLFVRFRKSIVDKNVVLTFHTGKNNLQGFQVYKKKEFMGIIMPIKVLDA